MEQALAIEFLATVRTFNQAMDGPSTDAEVDAACAMRDSAIELLRELGSRDTHAAKLLKEFESEATDA
jgi:hypothetical protein